MSKEKLVSGEVCCLFLVDRLYKVGGTLKCPHKPTSQSSLSLTLYKQSAEFELQNSYFRLDTTFSTNS